MSGNFKITVQGGETGLTSGCSYDHPESAQFVLDAINEGVAELARKGATVELVEVLWERPDRPPAKLVQYVPLQAIIKRLEFQIATEKADKLLHEGKIEDPSCAPTAVVVE